jgi:hypothetical protein
MMAMRGRCAGLEARIPSLSWTECLIIEEVRLRLAEGFSAADAQSHVETIAASGISLADLREFVIEEFCSSWRRWDSGHAAGAHAPHE